MRLASSAARWRPERPDASRAVRWFSRSVRFGNGAVIGLGLTCCSALVCLIGPGRPPGSGSGGGRGGAKQPPSANLSWRSDLFRLVPHIFVWGSCFYRNLEAIAIRLEAVAIRFEAVAMRLEAIAVRLEAVAIKRLKAIALIGLLSVSRCPAHPLHSLTCTHLLTHSLTHPPMHTRTRSLTQLNSHSLTRSWVI